ncbi:hypothetical protein ESCOMA179M1_22560 [Escherichia coli]|nr:hypothetical protein BvCmsHHNP024_03626 [Escherichia coli]CAD6081929.1 Uncharacterised protein [Escherichia coli]
MISKSTLLSVLQVKVGEPEEIQVVKVAQLISVP